MTLDEMLFFDPRPAALPLYTKLRDSITAAIPGVRVEVKKTQISFFTKLLFAAASFTPVIRVRERPTPFLTVSFILPYRIPSGRVDAAVEPYPGRWTHHVTIGSPDEVDAELMAWIQEAAAFAAARY